MEVKARKERIDLLLTDLARSTAPENVWLLEVIELQLEDAKDRLINADGVDVPRIQGEARFLEKLSRQLTAASALLAKRGA